MSIAEISKKTKKVFDSYHIAKASVFGSYAQGTEKKTSDIDILVSFTKKMSIFDIMSMKEDLVSVLKKKIDIVSEKGILPEFKKHIYSKTVPIYAKR